MTRRTMTRIAFAMATLLVAVRPSFAGKKTYVGGKVQGSRQVSMDKISHSSWDSLLRKYVDSDGLVDYKTLKATKSDMAILESYIGTLSTASLTAKATPEAKLAYWINAYNSVTVYGMLREYPTTSIRNHTAKLLGYNIWHDLQLRVGGKTFSLDDIEHKLLRKMKEPRIHFAIVCASIGCPRLLNEAYVASKLEQQLDLNSKDFFARFQNFRFDTSTQRFYLSSILSWFGEDFGRNQAAQLKTISKWLPPGKAKQTASAGKGSVKFLDYDWDINEQKSGR